MATLAMAGAGSLVAVGWAVASGWPSWASVTVGLIPWVPIFSRQTFAIYGRSRWLAVGFVLVVTQTAHFFEHVAQMTQIHVLGVVGRDAHGIFGALDIEWVHFLWNTWVIAAIALLVFARGPRTWFWFPLALAAWHELEHVVVFWTYLTTAVAGSPGLLASGGLLGGGLPLSRPDLHFLYNLVETIALIAAFTIELRRAQIAGGAISLVGRPNRVGELLASSSPAHSTDTSRS